MLHSALAHDPTTIPAELKRDWGMLGCGEESDRLYTCWVWRHCFLERLIRDWQSSEDLSDSRLVVSMEAAIYHIVWPLLCCQWVPRQGILSRFSELANSHQSLVTWAKQRASSPVHRRDIQEQSRSQSLSFLCKYRENITICVWNTMPSFRVPTRKWTGWVPVTIQAQCMQWLNLLSHWSGIQPAVCFSFWYFFGRIFSSGMWCDFTSNAFGVQVVGVVLANALMQSILRGPATHQEERAELQVAYELGRLSCQRRDSI